MIHAKKVNVSTEGNVERKLSRQTQYILRMRYQRIFTVNVHLRGVEPIAKLTMMTALVYNVQKTKYASIWLDDTNAVVHKVKLGLLAKTTLMNVPQNLVRTTEPVPMSKMDTGKILY